MWFTVKSNSAKAGTVNSLKCMQLATAVILIAVSFVSSDEINLPLKLREYLVEKDSDTLLKRDFISKFLNGCPESLNSSISTQFCTMYYNMVYNIYNHTTKSDEVKEILEKAIKDADNPSSSDFCSKFPSDVKNALVQLPITNDKPFNVTEFIQTPNLCGNVCLIFDIERPTVLIKVKKVCKVISVGCQWISMQRNKIAMNSSQPAAKSEPAENPTLKIAAQEELKQKVDQIQEPTIKQQTNAKPNATKLNSTDSKTMKATSPASKAVNIPVIDTAAAAAAEPLKSVATPKLTKTTVPTDSKPQKLPPTDENGDKTNNNGVAANDPLSPDANIPETSSEEAENISDEKTNNGTPSIRIYFNFRLDCQYLLIYFFFHFPSDFSLFLFFLRYRRYCRRKRCRRRSKRKRSNRIARRFKKRQQHATIDSRSASFSR